MAIERNVIINGIEYFVPIPVAEYVDRLERELAAAKEREAGRSHILYKDGDKDIPDVIRDSNGQVVLGLCRRCNGGESELEENCADRLKSQLAEARDKALEPWANLNAMERTAIVERLPSAICDVFTFPQLGCIYDTIRALRSKETRK